MEYLLFLIRNSFDDLKRNKIRTFLTSLGILIGVLAVVLLISFGLGLKNYIKNQFENLGTNLIVVLPGKILSSGGLRTGGGALGGVKFDDRDISKLRRVKGIATVAPIFVKTLEAKSPDKSEITDLYASTPDIFTIRNLEVDIGRLYTSSDNEKRAKNIVIGPSLAEKLYGNKHAALGKTIKILNQGFRVIGVLEKKGGGGLGPDFDSFSYIPFKASFSFNTDKKYIGIYLKAHSESTIPLAKTDIKKILLGKYDEDDFSVIEQTEILNVVTSIFTVLNSILISIGSISLVVGGIGIMNIMYASVTERIKEIGIRRAIGATKKDILLHFLTEATLLSLFGGLMGLFLSYAIVFAIQPFFPAEINLLSVGVALGVSSAIGIFFGVFPARQAANLSPIEAIRYE